MTFSNDFFLLLLPSLSFILDHFHFQKLIEISRVYFVTGIRKIYRSVFIERGGDKPLPQKVSSFLVLRRKGEWRGDRGESLREGEGEKHAFSHVQLFLQRRARERRERLLLEPPFHGATPARIRSCKYDSAMISAVDGRL